MTTMTHEEALSHIQPAIREKGTPDYRPEARTAFVEAAAEAVVGGLRELSFVEVVLEAERVRENGLRHSEFQAGDSAAREIEAR